MSEIKQGVYASVGGKVGRVFTYSGDRTGIEIHVQDERMRYPDRYTAFDVKDQVAEGDIVEVRGWLSTQVEEFTKRDGTIGHGVKRIVNAPKIAKHEAQDRAGSPGNTSGGDWTPAPTGGAQNASWDTADTTTPF